MRLPRLIALFAPTLLVAQTPTAYTLSAPNSKINEPFSRVMGALELTDGRVVVADFREGLLAIGDFKTGERQQLGRQGQGPNEYLGPSGLARRLVDTIYVFDVRNRRYLRLDGTGKILNMLPFSSKAREFGSPRGVDAKGNFYWTGGIVGRDEAGGYKRNQKSQILKWDLGADSIASAAEITDHAPELHDKSFHPYAERDAYVVLPNGRIGIVVARDYHLRWVENGKVIADHPPIPFTPIAVSARERDGFRAERALQGAAGGMTGGSGAPDTSRRAEARRTMLDYFPDAIFPKALPPFVENGARLSPRGDIWVERSRPAGDRIPRFDVLGVDGKVRATVQLPPATQLISLGQTAIYLIRVDDDGLQTLERYAWPAGLR